MLMTYPAKHERLTSTHQQKEYWKTWGPYLSERAWGTVREDYSADGSAWEYFPHDHARSRAYRWNEDGLAGICDRLQYLCFALALWNGHDPILKERLFGLTGPEGNHGEDVKEVYFYLDNLPSHRYMKMLYKYPQAAFPYADLIAENQRRGVDDFEHELTDTGVFSEDRYFDVLVEYARGEQNDVLVQISITNQAATPAPCTVLPTLWFRNTWSWGYKAGAMNDVPGKPSMSQIKSAKGLLAVQTQHPAQPSYTLYAENAADLLFTENETNTERLWGIPNTTPYVKDAFHHYIIQQEQGAINPAKTGTKAAALYQHDLAPGETWVLRLRLTDQNPKKPFADFDEIVQVCRQETDEFYEALQLAGLSVDEKRVQRQAFAGMLWSKQMYYYDVEQWLNGDPGAPPPPRQREYGRNREWRHLNNFDIISMPDKWEYPWYAAWDLAFHAIPLAMIDAEFARHQLLLMTREWYMHPNGQLPAYEWAFGDVNPPVHAWSAWRVYEINPNVDFLKKIYHKLLLNFTWWVNRKDADGNNIFQGGFLGLDNISLFDRSAKLPGGGHLDQSDGTAWMGFYALGMMHIGLELAKYDDVYQDLASKFYEHFLAIAVAMTSAGHQGHGLWDEEDGFFYDVLHLPGHAATSLKVRSMVGLLPLLAVETIEQSTLDAMPEFHRHMTWFVENRPYLTGNMANHEIPGVGQRTLIAILTPERLESVLHYMLDENEFLSDYGIRSLSKYHEAHPYSLIVDGQTFTINYQPAESLSGLFGGNSNWRGPIWFPVNYLLIEALRKFHHYYGDSFKVECPTGSGQMMTLAEVATEISRRLIRLFVRDDNGKRPIYGAVEFLQHDPGDNLLFHEYFHGDNGAGLGASHQTGWTGLIARLIQQVGEAEAG
jgi:hypothetical protein